MFHVSKLSNKDRGSLRVYPCQLFEELPEWSKLGSCRAKKINPLALSEFCILLSLKCNLGLLASYDAKPIGADLGRDTSYLH
ncbi:hypothetical protein CsSME_00053160 [Camellia sinensis var. sinensis]